MRQRRLHRSWGISRTIVLLSLALAGPLLSPPARALDQIFRQTDVDLSTEAQLLTNPSFEQGEGVAEKDGKGVQLPEWDFWQDGYAIVPGAGRNGGRAIQCSIDDDTTQCGAGQRVELNQEQPFPVVASAWSRAQDVSGSPDSGYSIYLDFIFQDGTTWWAQTSNFSTGTHDWEERHFIVVPKKPIRSVYVYLIFRGHMGTVYFDDVNLLELRGETYMFEGVPVRPQPVRAPVEKVWIPYMQTRNGLQMALERKRARVCGVWVNQEKVGLNGPGFFARDTAAKSDFLAPWNWEFNQQDSTLVIKGDIEPLSLRITASMTPREDRIQVSGLVEDLRGDERAVTVYFGLPVDDSGWFWCDDPRTSIPATATIYMNAISTVAGATGSMSRFPLGAIYQGAPSASPRNRGVAIAVPMHEPRHHRIGFDARTGLFFVAFDFGLAPNATATPGKATFDFVIYPFPARWGFRGALAAYYGIYPDSFKRRTTVEGLWLPKTPVTAIEGPEDFFFAYYSVRDNIGLNAQPGLLSFVHSDPSNVWVPLPESVPRKADDAVAFVQNQKPIGSDQISSSGILDVTGRPVLAIKDTPWCNGVAFAVNPDTGLTGSTNKGRHELDSALQRLSGSGTPALPGWPPLDGGYAVDKSAGRGGSSAIRLETSRNAPRAGAGQRVMVDQTEPKPLELRGFVKTKPLKSSLDDQCVISVTLVDSDGQSRTERVQVAREKDDYAQVAQTFESAKPITRATVKLLLRDESGATAWFDDLFLGAAGTEVNLLQDGQMEAEPVEAGGMSGVYVENISGWGTTVNYNSAHFTQAGLPLVYDNHTQKIGILSMFSTYEYLRALADPLRKDDKLIMASGAFGFPIHLVDIACLEVDWCREGRWYPSTDDTLATYRALAYQKPICLSLGTDFDSFLREPILADLDEKVDESVERQPSLIMAERYFQWALFYGMFPGFFSKDGDTGAFFENPDWYNMVRPLFVKYLPLIQELSKAGWEPITGAETAEAERVYLERYGRGEQGQVFITSRYGDQRWQMSTEEGRDVREQLAEPVTAEIDVNMAHVGFLGKESFEVFDLLAGAPIEFRYEQSHLYYSVTLQPHGVHLIRIRPAGG
ncbi:MAG TPA: hypothetical protein PKK44_07500 [Candidatus Hydrogenedentes bacterium]|nr:hypothetical protein [Candidatus Hydrogenedentota bacterium]